MRLLEEFQNHTQPHDFWCLFRPPSGCDHFCCVQALDDKQSELSSLTSDHGSLHHDLVNTTQRLADSTTAMSQLEVQLCDLRQQAEVLKSHLQDRDGELDVLRKEVAMVSAMAFLGR